MPTESHHLSEFSQLQTDYQQRIFSFILTLVPRWSDAEEILQETNVTLWEKRNQFEMGTNFLHWANRVAYFKSLEFCEKRRRGVLFFSEGFLEDVATEVTVRSESLQTQREALEICMQKLPEKDRALLSLRYLEGATIKSISQAVGRSVEAVYKALQRTRASLMACVRFVRIAEEDI